MSIKNSITAKNIIFLIMVILLIKFFSQITTTVMLFFVSYVFACSLNPIVDKLSKKLSRPAAASIVMGGTTLILFAVFLPLVIVTIKQVELLAMSLPEKIDTLKYFILHQKILGQNLISLIDFASIVEPVSKFTTNIVNQSIAMTLNLAAAVVYLLSLCVITYYFIVDKDTIRKGFMLLFPEHIKKKADTILTSISEKIGSYVIAQLIVTAGIGVCFFIPLFLMKIDSALLLGVLAAILDLIPIIGAAVTMILCVIICYHLKFLTVVLVLLFYLIAQWIQNNFIKPYVFGKFMDLHPLIIFFAIFVTAKFLGPIGVIFAPAIAATICVLIDELYIKPINTEADLSTNE